MIKFGEWRPDVASIDTQFAAVASNVIPAVNSYHPHPSMAPYSAAQLPSAAIGFCMARTADGTWSVFAGTTTKLYRYNNGTGVWSDVSRTVGGSYAGTSELGWSFAQFGTNLVAVNGVDAPQVFDIDSGSNFAALAGSPPVARRVAVVGDFLVLSGLVGNTRRIQWSSINNITAWVPGTLLSDYQDFPEGGAVTSVVGGKSGYVLQDNAMNRMVFQPGSDYVFTFTPIEENKGCIAPNGAMVVFGTLYFLTEDGFYSYGAGGLNPIGGSRVNEWFKANSDKARISQAIAIADPHRPRVSFAFYSAPIATTYDKIITYDWLLDRWSTANVRAQWWGTAATPGMTLEGLDAVGNVDTIQISFDSRIWTGGRPVVAAADELGRLAFMEGPSLEAFLSTSEFHAIPGSRAKVTNLYPYVEGQGAVFRVGSKARRDDSFIYRTAEPIQVTGHAPVVTSGRIFTVDATIPAGTVWDHIQGVDLEFVPDGSR